MSAASIRLDQLMEEAWKHGQEIGVEMSVTSESCWSGTLRFTPYPHNPDGPDLSLVWFTVAHEHPEGVLRELLAVAEPRIRETWTETNSVGAA